MLMVKLEQTLCHERPLCTKELGRVVQKLFLCHLENRGFAERGTIAYQSLRADCLEQLVLLFDLGGAERGLLLEGGHHGPLLLPHLPWVLSALLTRHSG